MIRLRGREAVDVWAEEFTAKSGHEGDLSPLSEGRARCGRHTHSHLKRRTAAVPTMRV
jgi:hypothetical protein